MRACTALVLLLARLRGAANTAFRCCDVPQVDADADGSRARFDDLLDAARPFVVRGGIEHWGARSWTPDSVRRQLGHRAVRFNLTTGASAQRQTQQFTEPLATFLDSVAQSAHGRSLFALDEALAFEDSAILDALGEVRLGDSRPAAQENFFRFFPPELRPPDRALIFGGAGAESSLHVDTHNCEATAPLSACPKLTHGVGVQGPAPTRCSSAQNTGAFGRQRPSCRASAAPGRAATSLQTSSARSAPSVSQWATATLSPTAGCLPSRRGRLASKSSSSLATPFGYPAGGGTRCITGPPRSASPASMSTRTRCRLLSHI